MARLRCIAFLAMVQCLCANVPYFSCAQASSAFTLEHAGMSERLRGGGLFGRRVSGRFGGVAPPRTTPPPSPPTSTAGAAGSDAGIVMANPASSTELIEDEEARARTAVTQTDNKYGSADFVSSAFAPLQAENKVVHNHERKFGSASSFSELLRAESGGSSVDDLAESAVKWLYIVSDSTGFTASHALTSVLAQFSTRVSVDDNTGQTSEEGEGPKFEVRTHMFSNVLEPVRLERIVQLAARMKACVIYTLVNPKLNLQMAERCDALGVEHEDLLGPLTTHLSEYLHASPTGLPRGAAGTKKQPLGTRYFSRIEAVEFTIKHDDGTLPVNLPKADVVLLGVSRSSKTPLAIYLAQQFGFKVANVPVLLDVPLPEQLMHVDPRRVFCLLVDDKYLRRVRAQRLANADLDFNHRINKVDYSDPEHIRRELENARQHYQAHPEWSVVDVTGRSVEENAAIIAELMPGKPTPVEAALHALDVNFFIIGNPHEALSRETSVEGFDEVYDSPILFASDGFLSSCGRERSEVIGHSPRFLHGPETDPASIAKVRTCMAESKEGSMEMVNYRKDGSCFRKILHLRPVRGHGGTDRLMFATQTEVDDAAAAGVREQHDDGDRVVEQLAITKRTQFVNSVQHKGGIAVGIWDGEVEGEDFPLLFASQGFFQMFGYVDAEDDIIGRPIDVLMGPLTSPECRAKITNALRERARVSTCVRMLRKDGTTFWNYLSLQPVMNADGSLRFFVGTMYSGIPGEGGLSRERAAALDQRAL